MTEDFLAQSGGRALPKGTLGRIYADAEATAQAVAQLLIERCKSQPRYSVALSGGKTPQRLYEILGAAPKETLAQLRLFWADERCVPPNHPASNYGVVQKAWLSSGGLPASQVYRIRGELPPAEAARDYDGTLSRYAPGGLDMVLLGVGGDGHTASLFPKAKELAEKQRRAVQVHRPDLPQPWRVSLTLPYLQHAKEIFFVVTGAEKQAVLRAILEDAAAVAAEYPAAEVHRTCRCTWLVDEAAALGL